MPVPNQYEKMEKNNQEKDLTTCERTLHQFAKIALPIEIEPFGIAGKITTKCCGLPHISLRECKDYCKYIITQKISIEIPVKFGALTETKKTYVECDKPDIEGKC